MALHSAPSAVATLEPTPLPLETELKAVEAVLHRFAASEVEALHASALHILGAGGKRLRPQLVLLCAKAVNGSVERAVALAAATELVHTATLVHDDVVDGAESRRGRRAVQFCFGNSVSILMGDFLVVRALRIVSDDGDPRVWRVLVDTIARMCEGEVLQIGAKGDTGVAIELYERVIECKTAILMRACGQFGAFTGNAVPNASRALAEFCHHLGMAFQIADDILDFTGDEDTLGKPIGTDLREGKVTLPVIYALEDASSAARAELALFYEDPSRASLQEIRHARDLIGAAGGFDRAREHALRYVRRAQGALAEVPASAARDALWTLAAGVVDRRA